MSRITGIYKLHFTIMMLFCIVVSGCNSHTTTQDPFLHLGRDAENAINSFNKPICVLSDEGRIKLYSAYVPEESGPITMSYKDDKTQTTITIIQFPESNVVQISENESKITRKESVLLHGNRVVIFFAEQGNIKKAYMSTKSKIGSIFIKIERRKSIDIEYIKYIVDHLIYKSSGDLCIDNFNK